MMKTTKDYIKVLEEAILRVNQLLSKANDLMKQYKDIGKELSKVEKPDKKTLEKVVESIEDCVIQLQKAIKILTKSICELHQHSLALNLEFEIKLHRFDDQITTAKKWRLVGFAAVCVGLVAALLSGPAAPVVFGIGITMATAGLQVGFYFNHKCGKYNEEQKKIDAHYTPLAEACKHKLDQGTIASEAAKEKIQHLQEVINDYKTIKQK